MEQELDKEANKWAENMIYMFVDMNRKPNEDERNALVQEYKDLQKHFTKGLQEQIEAKNIQIKELEEQKLYWKDSSFDWRHKFFKKDLVKRLVAKDKRLTKAKEILELGLEGIKREFIVAGNKQPFREEAIKLCNEYCERAEAFIKE